MAIDCRSVFFLPDNVLDIVSGISLIVLAQILHAFVVQLKSGKSMIRLATFLLIDGLHAAHEL